MKTFFYFIIIQLISLASFSQKNKNDWEKLELKNRPKILISINNTGTTKTMNFNTDGFITQEIFDCQCQREETKFTDYKYSDRNKLVEKVELTKSKNEIIEHIVYTYDATGHEKYDILVESKRIQISKERLVNNHNAIEVKKNNNKKQVVEKTLTLKLDDKTEVEKYNYIYDSKGNWINEIFSEKGLYEEILQKKDEINRKIIYY